MSEHESDRTGPSQQRHMALSRWDREAAAPPEGLSEVPALTDTELVHLRIRIIALENLVISLLSSTSDQQLELAHKMANYILPRAGFTQHPLTIHAAHQMIDLVERAAHFRSGVTPEVE